MDMLYAKGIPSPSGNPKWGRAAVDKLLSNVKYIPIVGVETYMDAQFERERRKHGSASRACGKRYAGRTP